MKKIKFNVEALNKNISSYAPEGGYKNDGNSWSIFYLMKELITAFSKEGFNYFRGQRKDWETIPSLFRNLKNENREQYFRNFEDLYKKINREFPDDIEYVKYDEETIEERADQLAILQHYGMPTSLLDITENPFFALLFMLGINDEVFCPQLEMYRIDEIKHQNEGILSLGKKLLRNRRIKAQKGAFLNYDKIYKRKLEDIRIERVIVKLKVLVYDKKDELNNDNEKEVYKNIQDELKRKLSEYNYEYHNMFPDFENYISYVSKQYKEEVLEEKYDEYKVDMNIRNAKKEN